MWASKTQYSKFGGKQKQTQTSEEKFKENCGMIELILELFHFLTFIFREKNGEKVKKKVDEYK